MRLTAVIFDLGNTLIRQQIDDLVTLDQLTLEPIAGATEMLSELRCRYKLGLLSNTRQSLEHHVRRALVKLGWDGVFEGVVTSVDVRSEKPAQIGFDRVLELLNVAAADAVMVGNDMEADILGGSRAGLRTVFFSCDDADWQAQRNSACQPDYVVHNLADLPFLLHSIEASRLGGT
ncbi:MAG TPA: HAD hydrolase-like protein [Micromonosporaceae bacterium]|nr:HAD hydrolase-like protein [Micromonosporaceae bacterium]